jgi:hypothetical protein
LEDVGGVLGRDQHARADSREPVFAEAAPDSLVPVIGADAPFDYLAVAGAFKFESTHGEPRLCVEDLILKRVPNEHNIFL